MKKKRRWDRRLTRADESKTREANNGEASRQFLSQLYAFVFVMVRLSDG